MLESSGFDFRSRYPQKPLLKIARHYDVDRETVGKTAYNMSLDLYRTFAPLKQTTSTMAIACVELSARIFEQHIDELEAGKSYKEWKTTRPEVMGSCLFFRFAPSGHRSCIIDLMNDRNPPGSTRPLHPPSHHHNHWARPCPRNFHCSPHSTKPRSLHEQLPTPHAEPQEDDLSQRQQNSY